MATTITVLALLLLNGALRASAGEGGSLLDVYSSRQAPVRQPGTVTIQSVGVSPVACMDAGACLAQCSTDPLLNQDPAAVQAQVRRRSLQRSQADGARALTPGGGRAARQLVQCTNNMRLAPGLVQQDISAVCSYDDVQAAAAGLGALQGSAALSGVAQAHSDEEAAQNYFSHFSSNGSSPYDRVRSVLPDGDFVSELSAAGWPTVRSVLVQLLWCAPRTAAAVAARPGPTRGADCLLPGAAAPPSTGASS